MRPRDRLALILVALTLAFTTLALGGAPRWAAGIGALLAIATAVPYVTSRRTSSHPPVLLFPIAVAAGLTLLQLVPLPIFIAEIVAPSKLGLVRDNAAAWGDAPPTWVVVSFDPPATLVELAKLCGYLALAYTCTRLASIRRARHWLAVVVAGVATLAAVVTLVHHALGLSALYGLYTPSFKPHILGPLLGVNHLASLLSLAVPVALALAVSSAGLPRLAWLTSAATLAATTLLTGSRGGAVGLLAGLVVAVVLLLIQRRAGTSETNRQVPLSVIIPAGVVAACLIALVALLTAGDVATDLSRTSLSEIDRPDSKFQLWSRSTDLVTMNRWLGVGKGAFEPAFTPHAETAAVIYSHVENTYLQAILDWGLAGAALLFLACAHAARRGVHRWRHGPLEAGVVGGLAALVVHDVADFSLEMPAIGMMTVAIASVIFPARLGSPAEADGARAKAAPGNLIATRVAVATTALLIVILAISPVGRTARADAERIGATSDVAGRIERAQAGHSRHPGDHVIAGRAAEALFASRDSGGIPDARALAVMRRAIAMNPHHPGLHHLAARMLRFSSNPDQAAPEFAAAARWSRDVQPVVDDVVAALRDPADAARALPPEPVHAWRVFAALIDAKPVRLAYMQRVAVLNPRDAAMHGLLAAAAIEAELPEVAIAAARVAWELDPAARHATYLGRALALAGRRAEAIALLQDAASRDQRSTVAERCSLLFILAQLQAETGDLAGARASLDRVAEVGARDRGLLVTMHLHLALVEDRLGNRNQAEWQRQRARELAAD